MAERTSSGLLTMMLEPTPAVAMTLPAEVREKLAELELELSEGKLTTTRTQTENMLCVSVRVCVFLSMDGALNMVHVCV